MKYEVHWSQWLSNHLAGEWEEFTEKFESKRDAVDHAKTLTDQEDVEFIKVYKVINWKRQRSSGRERKINHE